MIIPIRCFTCGKVIGDKWDDYVRLQSEGYQANDALDLLGLHRMCCRRIYVTHVEQTHILLKFNANDRARRMENEA